MAEVDIDFEGQGGNGATGGSGEGTQGGNGANSGKQEDVTNLGGGGTDDITGKDNNGNGNSNQGGNNGNQGSNGENGNGEGGAQSGEGGDSANNSSTGELNAGDHVEFDGVTYTVAENGDLVDDKGEVFKKKDEIQNWINSLEQEDDNTLDLEGIQTAVGVYDQMAGVNVHLS